MGLETATYIKDLVSTNPTISDFVSQGDDHLRMLKSVLQNTFPSLTGPTLPTSTGTANAQVVTHLFAPTSYQAGQLVAFVAGFTNTGAMTLNVNGLGAKSLFISGAAAVAGAVIAGSIITAIYDGTQFQAIIMSNGPLYANGVDANGNGLVVSGSTGQGGYILLKTPAAAGGAGVFSQVNNLLRWGLSLADGSAESSGNLGSNFVIWRYSDTGAFIDTPLTINRATGAVTLTGADANWNSLIIKGPVGRGSNILLNAANAADGASIAGAVNNLARWVVYTASGEAESGGNTGSNFAIWRCTDAGTFIDAPMRITRSSAVTTFSVPIVNGPSDRSLKENIEPLTGALDKVMQLQGVSFNMIGDEDKRRQIGLIAQDVEPIVPEVIQDFSSTIPAADEKSEPVAVHKLALDYPKLTALLIEAVKTLTARVEALETQLAGVQHA